MKKIWFILIVCNLLIMNACKHETVFNLVSIPGKFSILIPDYLSKTNDLHPEASVQYQNSQKEIYVMVINEKKIKLQEQGLDLNLDEYYKSLVSQPFMENIKDGKVSIPGRQDINGLKALVTDITGKIAKNDVYYKLAIVESPYEFYQILVWTLGKNKSTYETDMIKTVESFKELPHPSEELPTQKLSDSVSITPTWEK